MDGATRTRHLVCLALASLVGSQAGCTGTVGTTAASMLRKVKESPDPNVRHLAYAKLSSLRAYDSEEQKAEAASVLAAQLEAGKEPVASRAVICHTLGELRRPEGRAVLIKSVGDPEPSVRSAACRALGLVGQPEDSIVLAKLMATDSDRDCQIAAIEAMAMIKSPDPRIDTVLVDGMESSDPAIRLASLEALRSTSGQDFGLEVEPWKKYAEQRAQSVAATAPPARR